MDDPALDHDLTLTALVPAYNEEATIETVLNSLMAVDMNLVQVVVVDDGSKDKTAAIVERLAAADERIELHQQSNQGKTAAIANALGHAHGDVIFIQDADLEYDPAELPEVVRPILTGQADVVYGSRFLVRRAARVLYFYHYLANSGLTFLSNLLTNRNMTDIETCYKAFRAEVIKPLRLTSSGFGMEVEITALVCKTMARTYEVPISYHGRTYEEGKKIGVWDGVQALYYIFFFNLIRPFQSEGRQYIETVDAALRAQRREPEVPAVAEPATSS